jgi:hypothetical protein
MGIAQAIGSTIEELQRVNCLQNINALRVGDSLYVPRLPGLVATPIGGFTAEGCTDASTSLIAPMIGETVTGVIQILGTAYRPDMAYYKLEIRPDYLTVYTEYSRSTFPISAGILGQLDTAIFAPGLYWLRLTVVGNDQTFGQPCAVPMVIRR